MAASQHVVPSPGGGWSVKKGGAVRASKTFDDKQQAIEYARVVSRKQGSDLYIHRRDGTVQRKDDGGKSPPSVRRRDAP